MKRKRFAIPDISILKWHAFFFVLFTVFLWMSVLATIEYPGNAEVPFEVFKPFLVERMGMNILWGVVLLTHFGARAVQDMLMQRTLRLDSPNLIDEAYGERMQRIGDDDVVLIDEEGRPFKRQRSS